MKYLNVAEKNDAAKNISAILSRGASNRREGLSQYNKIYEFKMTLMGRPCDMVMTSVSGHLLDLEFVGAVRNWNSCHPGALFDTPVIQFCPENSLKIKKTLEREVRSCQGLIIWTDCDREGENIGYEIIKVCKDVKPNIEVYRAKFSEITSASIFRAVNNLGRPDKKVSDAVDVRRELDLRTGAAFTRLQTLRLQRIFPNKLADKLISYGSCQFPTLGFVVERYKAIEEFIPEPFWKIKMNHTVAELTTEFLWKRNRLFDKAACEAILDICKENPTAKVETVDSKPKSKWRPVPLDTVEMEKNISKMLRINAKDCMKIAEKLYTQGIISYPRTETNIFPKELNLTSLVEQQREDRQWGAFAERILCEGGPAPRNGKKSDQAHPPIHPTKYTNQLNGNEARVYEYIVRHFLACVQKDAQGFETTVQVDITGEKFTAKGLLILEKNYLEVYIYDKWNAKEINTYQVGDTFQPTMLQMTEGTTTAPSFLTEAELIALMEKHEIGTDATHAEHIDTIKTREYVGLHENIYFVPGVLGMGLVEGYNNIELEISLAKPTLRAEFEKDLKMICEGRKDAETVRREQIMKYKAVFEKVAEKIAEIDTSLARRLEDQPQQLQNDITYDTVEYRPVMKCPKCGSDMILKKRKEGDRFYMSCVCYPACKNGVWFENIIDTVEVLDDACNTCQAKKLKFKFKLNPFPGDPNPNVLCIGGCDAVVLENLNINIASVKKVTIANNAQNQNVGSNNTRNHVSRQNNPNRGNGFPLINSQRPNSNNSTLGLMPGSSGNQRPTGGRASFNNTTINNGEEVFCNCNKTAILLTVQKDTPNKGRKFYNCSNRTCNFFLWADEMPPPNQQRNADILKCLCNIPAVERTVNKEGPNKGRKFYCCQNPPEQRCKFFKWSDEVDQNNGGGGGGDDNDNPGGGGAAYRNSFNTNSRSNTGNRSNSNKRKRQTKTKSESAGSTTRAKRKCGICGQEGHIRSKCTNK